MFWIVLAENVRNVKTPGYLNEQKILSFFFYDRVENGNWLYFSTWNFQL